MPHPFISPRGGKLMPPLQKVRQQLGGGERPLSWAAAVAGPGKPPKNQGTPAFSPNYIHSTI